MLPKDWNDITIEQYVAFHKTLSEDPKDDEGLWRLLIKRIALLTGNDPDLVEDSLTMSDLNKMAEFQRLPMPSKLIKNFRFNGKRYTVDIDPTKYNAGRYMSVMNQLRDDRIENAHKMIFQVCREVGFGFYRNAKGKLRFGNYTIEPDLNKIQETIESFKQLPLKIAEPIRFFFVRLSENLTADTQEYLTKEIQKQTKSLQTEIDCLSDSDG